MLKVFSHTVRVRQCPRSEAWEKERSAGYEMRERKKKAEGEQGCGSAAGRRARISHHAHVINVAPLHLITTSKQNEVTRRTGTVRN